MLASGQGHPALAAGDAIGANLVILTLTLGLAALVTRLPVTRRSVEYGVAAAVLGAVAYLFMLNGVLGRLEGAVLVSLYVAGVVWVWRRERTPPLIGEMAELEEKDRLHVGEGAGDEATGRALLMVLLGLLGMVVGGFLAVRGAEGLVDALGLTESVVGLTVLALATSAEMVALVWAARRRGLTEVVVAGTVGAVAYNATVSLGLAALVSPLGLGRHNLVVTTAGVTAVLPLVLLVGLRRGRLPKSVGALLVVAYVGAMAFLFAR
jgi:cation:H+ antiporter